MWQSVKIYCPLLICSTPYILSPPILVYICQPTSLQKVDLQPLFQDHGRPPNINMLAFLPIVLDIFIYNLFIIGGRGSLRLVYF